ncbi:hypothetical protein [Streptomyces sp. bgisy100]|uniref:hypothetical protein n=1 Tax=Streptomyces sp. bgisy100 TaxID=3413783 RepID=UPI003D746991
MPCERWRVDQDESNGLVLAAFIPKDVDPGRAVSSGVLASFAYPDSPERATHIWALGSAAHMTALDPPAAWLKAMDDFEDRAEKLTDLQERRLDPAARFARTYLRTTE